MLPVLPHDRCGRFKPNADAAALVDISALGGYSTDDILSGQYRCHVAATLTGRLLSHAIVGVNRFWTASLQFTRVIPEIDIWRAANLMLKRYGEKAFEESSTRADELAADGDSRWRIDVAPDYRSWPFSSQYTYHDGGVAGSRCFSTILFNTLTIIAH